MALNIEKKNVTTKAVRSALSTAAEDFAPILKSELLNNGDDLATGLIDAFSSCESMAIVVYRDKAYLVIEGLAANWLVPLESPEYPALVQKAIKSATGRGKHPKALEAAIATQISDAIIDSVEIDGSEFNAHINIEGSKGVVICSNDPEGKAILLNKGEVTEICKPTGINFELKPKNGRIQISDKDLTRDQFTDFRNLFSNLFTDQFYLLMAMVTFILAQPRTEGLSYPISYIWGGAGSGKTTVARLVSKLLGLREAIVKTLPTCIKNLVATAANDHMMVFDNSSKIKDVISDAFCSVSTGGTVGGRTLHTNTGITETRLHQPMLITAIEVAKQQDLMTRCVFFSVKKPSISYKNEHEMYQILDAMLPEVQTWLLKMSAQALEYIDSVEPVAQHRAATFCVWVAAFEKAMGIRDQSVQKHFDQSYRETLKLQSLTHDPVLSSIVSSATELKNISGTPTNIHRSLTNHIEANEGRLPRKWPANANALANKLGVIEDNLAKHGILFERDLQRDHKGRKQWKLSVAPKVSEKMVETAPIKPEVSQVTTPDTVEENIKVVVEVVTDTPELELDEEALLEMQKEQDLEYELGVDLEIDDGVHTNFSVEDIDPELDAMLADI